MEYRNAKYISERGDIDCEILHAEYGWIPYTLNLDDTDMTVDNGELLRVMNIRNDITAYAPPTQAELDEQQAFDVRFERDLRLQNEVDPIAGNALRWASLSEEKQQEWAVYRIALLNVPQQEGFPWSVEWPIKPE